MEQKNLNLLKPTEAYQPSAPLKSFLEWSVKIGRVVIVVTELIVLAVFFARFKLDRDLLDLSNSITTKLEVLATTEEFEREFRNVQERLEMIRGIYDDKTILSERVETFVDRIPQEINLDSLSIEKSSINFSAKAPSGTIFAELIHGFRKMSGVRTIVLKSSRFEPKAQQYIFTISLEF